MKRKLIFHQTLDKGNEKGFITMRGIKYVLNQVHENHARYEPL